MSQDWHKLKKDQTLGNNLFKILMDMHILHGSWKWETVKNLTDR